MKTTLTPQSLVPLKKNLEGEGFTDLTDLPSGELAGLLPYLFTTGLVSGLTETGYRIRFCFENQIEARQALKAWDGRGFPSGKWIKAKGTDESGKPIDEPNPNLEMEPVNATPPKIQPRHPNKT